MRRLLFALTVLALTCLSGISHAQSESIFGGTSTTTPSITSCTGIGTSGGNFSCLGSNFSLLAIYLDETSLGLGKRTYLSAVGADTGTQFVRKAPAMSAGTYDFIVTNGDGVEMLIAGGVNVTTESDPATILSTCIEADYRADTTVSCSGTCSNGGALSSWGDKSGNGNASLTASGTAKPTWNAADSNYNSQPSVTFNGSTNCMTASPFLDVLGNTESFFSSLNATASGASSTVLFGMGGTSSTAGIYTFLTQTTGIPTIDVFNALSQAWGSSISGTGPTQMYSFGVNTSGTNYTFGLSIANAPQNTNTGTTAAVFGTTKTAYIGCQVGTKFSNFTTPEIVYANCQPTNTQINQLARYFSQHYHLPGPTFTTATNVCSSLGGVIRISGTNFVNGVAVTAGGGIGALTTTFKSSTIIEATVPASEPAGFYSLTITNPDSSNVVVPFGIDVLSSCTTDFVAAGGGAGHVVGVWLPTSGNVTCASPPCANGGAVTALANQALWTGNFGASSTAEPTYQSGVSDATFNNQPYLVFNGSTNCMSIASFDWESVPSNMYILAVAKTTSASGSQTIADNGNQTLSLRYVSGVPTFSVNALVASWTGSVAASGALNLTGYLTGSGSGPASINVSNGTAQTASGSSGSIVQTYAAALGARINGGTCSQFANASVAAVVYFNGDPTSYKSNYETLAHNRFGTP